MRARKFQNLINDVGIESDVKFITRIGKLCNTKIRPIKVVLESGHKRYLMTKGLVNLKGKRMYEGKRDGGLHIVQEKHYQRMGSES